MSSVRMLSRRFQDAGLDDIDALLRSPIHEARLLALLLMVQAFRRSPEPKQRRIYRLYLSRTRFDQQLGPCGFVGAADRRRLVGRPHPHPAPEAGALEVVVGSAASRLLRLTILSGKASWRTRSP